MRSIVRAYLGYSLASAPRVDGRLQPPFRAHDCAHEVISRANFRAACAALSHQCRISSARPLGERSRAGRRPHSRRGLPLRRSADVSGRVASRRGRGDGHSATRAGTAATMCWFPFVSPTGPKGRSVISPMATARSPRNGSKSSAERVPQCSKIFAAWNLCAPAANRSPRPAGARTKGIAASGKHLTRFIQGKREAPFRFEDLVCSTLATLRIDESVATGKRLMVDTADFLRDAQRSSSVQPTLDE